MTTTQLKEEGGNEGKIKREASRMVRNEDRECKKRWCVAIP
jgi:hypothetical protein